ncbi:MAG: hypothetical protein ACOY46_11875 [Bacillota bacterium]
MSTVYILGAGASASYDKSYSGMQCPSAKNFFTVACRVIHSDPGENFQKYCDIIKFLEEYFNLPLQRLEDAGIDMQDVLTFLDLELEYSDSISEIELLRKAKREFMELLTATFSRVLKGPPCPYHSALASFLHPGDTVISFNYDLLMDTALCTSALWNPRTGYGFRAQAEENAVGIDPDRSQVLLLKPHGSFNWVTCRACARVYVMSPSMFDDPDNWEYSTSVEFEPESHDLERLIIPPSVKKNVHGKIMQQIWTKAHDALKKALQIVIIGYSLPAADFMAKRLLYRSLSHNINLNKLEVVDRNNDGLSSPLVKKYSNMLYNSKKPVKLVCEKKSLREYVQLSKTDAKKL